MQARQRHLQHVRPSLLLLIMQQQKQKQTKSRQQVKATMQLTTVQLTARELHWWQ
jgi:hypothetical protein